MSNPRIMITASLPNPAKACLPGSKRVKIRVKSTPRATTSAEIFSCQKSIAATRMIPSSKPIWRVMLPILENPWVAVRLELRKENHGALLALLRIEQLHRLLGRHGHRFHRTAFTFLRLIFVTFLRLGLIFLLLLLLRLLLLLFLLLLLLLLLFFLLLLLLRIFRRLVLVLLLLLILLLFVLFILIVLLLVVFILILFLLLLLLLLFEFLQFLLHQFLVELGVGVVRIELQGALIIGNGVFPLFHFLIGFGSGFAGAK